MKKLIFLIATIFLVSCSDLANPFPISWRAKDLTNNTVVIIDTQDGYNIGDTILQYRGRPDKLTPHKFVLINKVSGGR